MTFTFIIMDSLYIMRNLLMIFFLMVVFWTNLGNCEGSCDRYTQCHYNETRIHSTVSCYIEKARGNTAHPCYGDGSIITCSCNNENYQLSSPNHSYLCRPDEWEDGLYDLHCLSALPCDEPAPPDDLVFHYPDFAQGEMYPNGTEILYYCPDGLDLNGNRIAVCLYGVWTYEDANCTGSCDKYTQFHYNETRMHSTVSCKNETAGNTTHPCYGDGSKVTCSCRSENYQLSSPNHSYLCRPDKREDGLYDLHCLTASPCDEPAPPDDLVFHSPDFAKGEMYANGTEIMYDCPDGLNLIGNMTAVCLYGVWTYEDAYCTALPCEEPAPPDDKVSHSPDFAEGETYANGTEIMYDCPDGLNLNGHMTAVCLYGEWTYEDAYCTASPCDEPAPPDDLVFHYPDFAKGEMYPNGTEIMYYCPDGDYLYGNRFAVCLNGVWTHEDAYCTGELTTEMSTIPIDTTTTTPALPCDEPAPPDDKVSHFPDFAEGEMYPNGTEIMYYCPDGLDLNGNRTAVCLYGVWTYEDAYCTALPCDEPAPPDDKVSHFPELAEGEMYPNGTEIMYYCPDGLDLNGNRTAVCLYGVWTYEDAYCTGELTTEMSTIPIDTTTTTPGELTTEMSTTPIDTSATTPGELTTEMSTIPIDTTTTTPGELTTEMSTIRIDTITTTPASQCNGNATQADLVCHSPDFAEGEMYANGAVIMNNCPDGLFFKDHMTAVCLYGVWTYEDANCIDWWKILPLLIIAIFTLLNAVQLIWLVKKHYLRRGTKWIPSVEGVANEQVPPTANDESKFVSKVTFEMRDPNAYQNDVNKEENDVTDHVGDNSPDDSPNNDPEEETV